MLVILILVESSGKGKILCPCTFISFNFVYNNLVTMKEGKLKIYRKFDLSLGPAFIFASIVSILVSPGCYNNVPLTVWFINKRSFS